MPICLLNIINKLYVTFLYLKLVDWVPNENTIAEEHAVFRYEWSALDYCVLDRKNILYSSMLPF